MGSAGYLTTLNEQIFPLIHFVFPDDTGISQDPDARSHQAQVTIEVVHETSFSHIYCPLK